MLRKASPKANPKTRYANKEPIPKPFKSESLVEPIKSEIEEYSDEYIETDKVTSEQYSEFKDTKR